MKKLFIGIDNGVTGTIGILGNTYSDFIETPIIKQQNYVKKKDIISRLNVEGFKKIILSSIENNKVKNEEVFIMFERPLVNPTRFKSTISAVRLLEAQLTIIESLNLSYQYCDSKEWQKFYLPTGTKGNEDLKFESKEIGCRTFPQFKVLIQKHKDADGLFIALYAKQKGENI